MAPEPTPGSGPGLDRDLGSSLAGGAAGLALLLTVNWDKIPAGEEWKLGMVVFLVLTGVLLYREKKGQS